MRTFILLLAAFSVLGAQSVYRVPQDAPTIGQALAQASRGDHVVVSPGVYIESLSFGEGISLSGSGSGDCIIDARSLGLPALALGSSSCELLVQGFRLMGGDRAVYLTNCCVQIVDCAITDSSSQSDGGGIYMDFSDLHLIGCRIENNSAAGSGGGVYGATPSSIKVMDCQFWNNSAGGNGGALAFGDEDPNDIVENSLFSGNTAAQNGGAIAICGTGQAGFPVSIARSTFSGNSAIQGGGIFIQNLGLLSLSSSIIWGESPDGVGSIGSMLQAGFCDVQGGLLPGAGNRSLDPSFVNPAAGDFRLAPGSIGIDRGDLSWVDPDGSRADMGWLDALPRLSGFAIGNSRILPPAVVTGPDLLTINGSTGGLARRVDLPTSASLSFSFLQDPTSMSGPVPFLLLGSMAAPDFGSQTSIGGAGGLAAIPCFLDTQGLAFEVVNNLIATGPNCQPLIPSVPVAGSWNLTIPGGLLPPLRVIFQAVFLHEAIPGYSGPFVRVSNALLLNSY